MEECLFRREEMQQTEHSSRHLFDLEGHQSILLQSEVKKDEYTDYVQKAFDLAVGDVSKVYIPSKLHIESLGEWNIGVICGASGSGKTTVLRHLAEKNGGSISYPIFDNSKSLISNFSSMTPKEAAILLSSMGLASVPTWIRPFSVLSNGEQYRASLAKAVCEAKESEIIYIDEYTSVVDRNVAMAMSNALQKYIRKNGKRIILSTCHYDVFEWLRPDWIYDLNKGGTLERGDYLRRPPIELQVYRTTSDTWERFKKHHYITSEMNLGAYSYCFEWNNKLVAFCSVLANPAKGITNGWRISRVVVLPDFQGLGIGRSVCDFVSSIFTQEGRTIYIKTANPALGEYLKKSHKWSPTIHNGSGRTLDMRDAQRFANRLTRPSYCYKYVGQPMSGYENLVIKIESMRRNKANENQLTLF